MDKKEIIIEFISENPGCSSKEILNGIDSSIAYATLKRALKVLVAENVIRTKGKGKGTKYELSPVFNIIKTINIDQYFKKEIDEREIKNSYNHLLIKDTVNMATLFTESEFSLLNILQNRFKANSSKLSEIDFKNELERLAIDLSWKSSQIEGNTYSLLETERLLKEKETADGKTKDEATMLINHKEALDFVIEHPDYINPLSIRIIEDIHTILIKDLKINRNLRNHSVGISGTNYKPLDNEFQIREALQDMCDTINKRENVFEMSLLILILISYIQPFSDGNKRTARIISNAILINNKYCPVSFRTVNSMEYKKALLIFYEQNNISAFKKIFIEQFEFAVNTYF
jgi:Fic family protein